MEKKESLEKRIENLRLAEHFTSPKLRAMCRQGFELSIANITSIAVGEKATSNDFAQIRAHEALRKCALGETPHYIIDQKDWLYAFCRVTARHFTTQKQVDDWFADLCKTFQYEQ